MTFNDFYQSLLESGALPEPTMDMMLAVIAEELRAEELRLEALKDELSKFEELVKMFSRSIIDPKTVENQAMAKERLRGNVERIKQKISNSTDTIAERQAERAARIQEQAGPQ